MGIEAKDICEICRHDESSLFDIVIISKDLRYLSIHSFGEVICEPYVELSESINISQADRALKCCCCDDAMDA